MADKRNSLDYSHFGDVQCQSRQLTMRGEIVNKYKTECIQLPLLYFLLGTVLLPLRLEYKELCTILCTQTLLNPTTIGINWYWPFL